MRVRPFFWLLLFMRSIPRLASDSTPAFQLYKPIFWQLSVPMQSLGTINHLDPNARRFPDVVATGKHHLVYFPHVKHFGFGGLVAMG